LKSIPFRVPHVLPAVRPSRAGADSHEVPRPFGGFPPTSPVCDDSSLPSRFRSQVLSTSQRFPGRSKLRGLVSCRRPPLGFHPSEPCSSPRSRTLLRAASSRAVLHRLSSSTSLAARLRSSAGPRGPSLLAVGPCGLPARPDVIARSLPLRVSPTRAPRGTFARFPAGARASFPPAFARARPPVSPPLSTTRASIRRTTPPASAASKPSSPREAVPRRRRSDIRGRCSPGLSPLQSLAPIEPRVLLPREQFRSLRASTATTRSATPRRQVKSSRPCGHSDLVGA
jgi:hypothetical protein